MLVKSKNIANNRYCLSFSFSTNKQLWNLIRGDTVVASEDVVHEELKNNGNKILSALTYYPCQSAPAAEGPTNLSTTTTGATDSTSSSAGGTATGENKDSSKTKLKKFISSKLVNFTCFHHHDFLGSSTRLTLLIAN